MKDSIRKRLAKGKRRIQRRLDPERLTGGQRPVLAAGNIDYELAERTRAIGHGGIGVIQLLARRLGLSDEIDRRLHLLKVHLPYHESDHVLNIAYNALCGGTCLEDIELRRNDEVFLDALGAARIPDPTTAGDFCRRFSDEDVLELQEIIDEARLRAWAEQPAEFFREARIDLDGTLAPTTGECKQGMDISYKGVWGYHPLLVSLANTGEVLRIANRSGNRPSHEGAWAYADDALALCRRAGFGRIFLRGDTDFTQTEYLDDWSDDPRVRFVFGIDSMSNLEASADGLPAKAWQRLWRRPKWTRQGAARRRPENVKQRLIKEREFENRRLVCEDVAEFAYQPTKCRKTYRVVVVRKNLTVAKGEQHLFDEIRYFFYITNDTERNAAAIVFDANERCHQENLIEQLKNGVRALQAPVDNLTSNWAYMVMAALAWNLKAWWALLLPERPGRWQEKHRQEKRTVLRMEFKKFVNNFVRLPAQIVRSGRKLIYRLLSWNPWQPVLFRLVDELRC